jgi:NADPH2:quinone reductase
MAGGDPDFINPRMLMDTSKTLTGGDYVELTSKRTTYQRAHQLFDWISSNKITITSYIFKLSKVRKHMII